MDIRHKLPNSSTDLFTTLQSFLVRSFINLRQRTSICPTILLKYCWQVVVCSFLVDSVTRKYLKNRRSREQTDIVGFLAFFSHVQCIQAHAWSVGSCKYFQQPLVDSVLTLGHKTGLSSLGKILLFGL